MYRFCSTVIAAAGILLIPICRSAAQQVEVQRLIWNTSGGGSIGFEIVRNGDEFEVQLTSYQFRPADQRIPLTAEDADVHRLVTDIFEGKRDLNDDTFVPRGPTGTWTTITLISAAGESSAFRNIEAWGQLALIPRFVESRIAHRP